MNVFGRTDRREDLKKILVKTNIFPNTVIKLIKPQNIKMLFLKKLNCKSINYFGTSFCIPRYFENSCVHLGTLKIQSGLKMGKIMQLNLCVLVVA